MFAAAWQFKIKENSELEKEMFMILAWMIHNAAGLDEKSYEDYRFELLKESESNGEGMQKLLFFLNWILSDTKLKSTHPTQEITYQKCLI